jgi:Tfp pilus assembly protein PilF
MHAQHVESVIWVAERKDVLCALFYFAGLYSYLKYHIDQRPEIKWVPFLFFFLALLSKSIAITFPLMLILLDYYPLERFNKKSLLLIFKEKIHYFLGSGVVVMITLLSQDVANVHQPSIVDTFWMVCLSIQHYILSFLYLEQLSPFHPEAIINDRNIQTYACLVIILVTAISSVIKFKKPAIAFILFFIISSFPILGIVNVGDHAYADRYAYIPVLPFYLLTGWLISGVWHKSENLRAGLLVLVIISLFFIGMVTREYKEIWKSDRDLWTYVADLYPQTSSIVHDNLGVTLLMEEDYESAIEQFNLAISLNNTPVDICKNRAFAYSYLGRFDDVLTSYHECIDIMPDNYLIHLHTGDAYLARGVKQSAHTYYTRTLDLVARNLMNVISDPDALLRLGTVFFQLGDNDRAVYALELVININQERRNDAQVILDANR